MADKPTFRTGKPTFRPGKPTFKKVRIERFDGPGPLLCLLIVAGFGLMVGLSVWRHWFAAVLQIVVLAAVLLLAALCLRLIRRNGITVLLQDLKETPDADASAPGRIVDAEVKFEEPSIQAGGAGESLADLAQAEKDQHWTEAPYPDPDEELNKPEDTQANDELRISE